MNGKELGKRIRDIRLSRKMTQSEVVGDFITRNMLSKIESGAAIPSLQTLQYLADSLKVPFSQLVPNQPSDLLQLLCDAKQALGEGRYEEALTLTNDFPSPLYDEAQAIEAQAHLGFAGELARAKELRSAVLHAKSAQQKAGNGIYASRDLRTKALLLLDQILQETEHNIALPENLG